jgi:hypothetical protein
VPEASGEVRVIVIGVAPVASKVDELVTEVRRAETAQELVL